MATIRQDEILGKALETDATVIPRYDVKDANGNVVVANATLTLKNPVVTPGMPVNKTTIEECLAASGTATGTSDALLLDQPNFTLFDGAPIHFKLPVDMNKNATLCINGTTAYPLVNSMGKGTKATAGSWVSAIFSAANSNFTLQGNGGEANKYGNGVGQISSYELLLFGQLREYYERSN